MTPETKDCRICHKPKNIHSYSPSSWKQKHPACSFCLTEYQKQRKRPGLSIPVLEEVRP